MFIYLASSRKNKKAAQDLGKILRNIGHEVFVFCDDNEASNKIGNVLANSPTTPLWTQKDAVTQELSVRIYQLDMSKLSKADCVLMLMPCGYSAHLEAGYMAGKKAIAVDPTRYHVVAYGVLMSGVWDCMYGMFDKVFGIDETDQMITYFMNIKQMEAIENARLAGQKSSVETEK